MKNFKLEVEQHPEKFCVQVVTVRGTFHFYDFNSAKRDFPELDTTKNGKNFTWAMYNGYCDCCDKEQMRFEDWETNERLSR